MDEQDGFGLTVAIPAAELSRLQRRVRFLDAAIGQMMREGGRLREWFTAGELATMQLPGLPTTRQGIAMAAARGCWATRRDGAPAGRRLYHFSGLPQRAFDTLITRVLHATVAPAGATIPPALPVAVAAVVTVAGNTTAPWVLPLLRLLRGKGAMPLDLAVRQLPHQVAAGVPCPTLDEARAVLRSLGVSGGRR